MADLEKLRREIDALDDELTKLVDRRAGLAAEIGKLKKGGPAYRPEREAEILRRISSRILPKERMVAIFQEIISACRSLEEAIRVSSVHEWDGNTLTPVKGAGGVSAARSEAEAGYAWNWARTIWADSLS